MRKIGVFMVCMAVFGFLYAGSARAVDVKFSGTFDVTGLYDARPTMDSSDASSALFFQELNLRAVFEVAPGLSLTTKIVALTKIWGDTDWNGTRGDSFGRPVGGGSAEIGPPSARVQASRARENIEIQEAYLTYNAGKVGTFRVGYVPHDTQWGTVWGTSERPCAIIQWGKPVGDFSFGLKYIKANEGSNTYKWQDNTSNNSDSDVYVGNVMYKKDFLFTGFKWAYLNNRAGRSATSPDWITLPRESTTTGHLLTPFVIMTFGPVKIEAEVEHFTGKRKFHGGTGNDLSMRTLAAFLNGEYTQGPFGVGATLAYASGNDGASGVMGQLPDTSFTSWGGLDYNPGLIMWNEDRNEWRGGLGASHLGSSGPIANNVRSGVANARMVSLYGNYKPTESWNLKLVWLYAKAAERAWNGGGRFVSKDYGHEVDFIATYKITNNLKYMVGAGYLFAGDYFKGSDKNNKVSDDYLFTNKLTLTF